MHEFPRNQLLLKGREGRLGREWEARLQAVLVTALASALRIVLNLARWSGSCSWAWISLGVSHLGKGHDHSGQGSSVSREFPRCVWGEGGTVADS